eukprot:6458074-Amphidinium_carterae.1
MSLLLCNIIVGHGPVRTAAHSVLQVWGPHAHVQTTQQEGAPCVMWTCRQTAGYANVYGVQIVEDNRPKAQKRVANTVSLPQLALFHVLFVFHSRAQAARAMKRPSSLTTSAAKRARTEACSVQLRACSRNVTGSCFLAPCGMHSPVL